MQSIHQVDNSKSNSHFSPPLTRGFLFLSEFGYNTRMLRKIHLFLSLLVLFYSFATFTFPPSVQAKIETTEWKGVCVGTGTASDVATIQGLQCVVANVLSVAITFIGLGGFAMLIMGGFKVLSSAGNAKGMEDGRNAITFSIIGLVVALSSWFILNIVSKFTGVPDILLFKIPGT